MENSVVGIIVAVLFWLTLFLIVHGFFLFPKLTLLLGKLLNKKIKRDLTFEPKISLFIPAYNEEKVIAKKIENVLTLDYPEDKLEILICSDCSDDRTGEIVNEYVKQYPQITFNDYRERSGKTGMINKAIPNAKGEIMVMTDANTMYEKDALRKIVSSFSSDDIAAVLGEVQLFVPEEGTGLEKEVNYRAFEAKIKYIEGLFGAGMGAFGGFYAFRKERFVSLPANAYSNDDFLIPARFVAQGYKVGFDNEAISHEETGTTVDEEFGRRVRIGAGNFQSFSFLLPMLNPFKFSRFYFYISHKVIRWFSPFILLTLLLCSFLLSCSHPVYSIILSGQLLAYSLATVGWILDKNKIRVPILQSLYHFTAMNIALFLGFFRFAKGIKSATWNSTERVEEE